VRDINLAIKGVKSSAVLIKFITVIIISWLASIVLAPEWTSSYAVIHTVLEVLCVVIALSAFLVIWFVSTTQPTNLILGLGFLVVAIFDTCHIFFWQGMDFFPNSYYDLSARYWVMGRFLEALFLVLSTTFVGRKLQNRYLGLGGAILFSLLVCGLLYYSPNAFPVFLTPDGVTPVKIAAEYIIIAMFILFLFRVFRGFLREDKVTNELLIVAALIVIPAELCFTVFTNITDFYNTLGHVLKISYYYFFLQAVFAGFVVYPYRMLHLSEERFHKAFQNSPVMKSIFTRKDNRLVDVNDIWLQIMGYQRAEVIGRSIQELDLYPKEVISEFKEGAWASPRFTNKRFSFRVKDGLLREGVFSAEEITLQGELCILMAVIDITEQVRNEKELLRLDRLNLVGQMAAGLGHEVRNPMTAVRGFLQMLNEQREYMQMQEYFHIMIEELDRANAIITDFLSLASDKSSNLIEHNLNKIVDDLYPLLSADALSDEKNILLEKQTVANVKIDGNEIRQLILNLVRNGLEAMPPGGQVTIKTFPVRDEIVLAIKDEGIGIDPQILDNIGTPFLTTKEKGTGLGLATCYSIVERNHASIEVQTSPNGTTFMVRFKAIA